jgi:hypothetical protein
MALGPTARITAHAINPPATHGRARCVVAQLTVSRAMTDLEPRVRATELTQAVHEATCAERYKAINLRLNIIMAGLGIVLAAIAAGDPLVGLLRAMAGH